MTHVEGRVDPIADAETVETELMLADLDSLERRVPNLVKKAQQGDKEAKIEASVLGQALDLLRASKPARLTEAEGRRGSSARSQRAQLLTAKPVLYVCNVDESDAADGNALSRPRVREGEGGERQRGCRSPPPSKRRSRPCPPKNATPSCPISDFRKPASSRIIRAGYELLGLITFFTAGPEGIARLDGAHGAKAPEAAGEIHTDFERGFIRAETIAFDDYVSSSAAKQAPRTPARCAPEGKEYVVQDGDVMLFRFNV